MSTIENRQNLYSGISRSKDETFSFARLADEINRQASHGKIVIGIFVDGAFAGRETPANLRYEHFLETWGRRDNVFIIPLDADQIRSYRIMLAHIDVLVFPYESVIPMDAYGLYSGSWFNHFIEKGGSVLTTGGIPFFKQANNHGETIPTGTPEEMTAVYDKWTGKFGIKYYPSTQTCSKHAVNEVILPSLAGREFTPARYGISVNNSSHSPVPKPPHGNVFPERYPSRQIIPLTWETDWSGEPTTWTGLLSQDYENGSVRVHFSHEGEMHPLSPEHPSFAQTMDELLTLFRKRVFAAELESQYACYRQGEAVDIKSRIISFERESAEVSVRLSIRADAQTVWEERKSISVACGETIIAWRYAPENFAHDEYTMTLTIECEGSVLSSAENAFVVWSDSVVNSRKPIALQNEYFQMDGCGRFVTGTNYYESTRGEIMWFRPDVTNIIRDFKQMRHCGINLIRPHYHHLKWFRDYLTYFHGKLFPFYGSLENYESYMPDERGWRIFDLFIYLCHKHNIIYNGDLFTLVPSEMGDPRGWFGTVETVLDPDCRTKQKQFLAAIETRYRDLPLIAWDLFNEPYMVSDGDVERWAEDLCQVIKDVNPHRLLCVGGPLSLGEALDFDCPHGRLAEDFINTKGKPVLMQELHIDQPEPLAYEVLQGEILRRCIVAAVRSGVAGVCPWSWTRQMRLWQDTYEHHHSFPMEKWDDRLGLHTHEDGTLKVAGRVFRNMALFLADICFVRYNSEALLCETDKGSVRATLADGRVSLYHFKKNTLIAAMDKGEIRFDGKPLVSSDSEGYIYLDVEKGLFKAEQAGTYRFVDGDRTTDIVVGLGEIDCWRKV